MQPQGWHLDGPNLREVGINANLGRWIRSSHCFITTTPTPTRSSLILVMSDNTIRRRDTSVLFEPNGVFGKYHAFFHPLGLILAICVGCRNCQQDW